MAKEKKLIKKVLKGGELAITDPLKVIRDSKKMKPKNWRLAFKGLI